MSNEADSRPLAKLVLLQQACCDSRLGSCAKGALAVILDACYSNARCFIGPTAIAAIADFNEKSVREAIKELEAAGYVRTAPRTKRSNWIYPTFQPQARLVTTDFDNPTKRVHRPAMPDRVLQVAGAQARYDMDQADDIAGVDAGHSGCFEPTQRVPTPDEAVIEAITETIESAPVVSIAKQGKAKRAHPAKELTFAEWIATIPKDQPCIPDGHSVLAYATRIGLPDDLLDLAWESFRALYEPNERKRYRDWPAVFRRAIEGDWLHLWRCDGPGRYTLTTAGQQAQIAYANAA